MVSGQINTGLEPRFSRPFVEPGARREMRLGERRTRDAAVGRGANLRQRVEIGTHAVGIDAKHHLGRCYCPRARFAELWQEAETPLQR